jgi:molecular chaperone GrpE
MELTLKMMVDALTKIGVSEISPQEGDAFNAEFHQAMSMQEVPGKESNSIVVVMQKGYLLNERLIRPAMVMVAK